MEHDYEKETKWIRDEARMIAEKTGRPFSSVMQRGLHAYNEGCDDEWVKERMWVTPKIHGHGSG